jgi:hypothetical protein
MCAGKDRVDDRRVISGILHVLKSGCLKWRHEPPHREGRPKTHRTAFSLAQFLPQDLRPPLHERTTRSRLAVLGGAVLGCAFLVLPHG